MVPVILALGSNLGDRYANLANSRMQLDDLLQNCTYSRVIESMPMYVSDQPKFLNQVVIAESSIGPVDLIRALQKIEVTLGRTRGERYGPRVIDLDIIAFGSLRYIGQFSTELNLTIPHPRLYERAFVVEPLLELQPDIRILGESVQERWMREQKSCEI